MIVELIASMVFLPQSLSKEHLRSGYHEACMKRLDVVFDKRAEVQDVEYDSWRQGAREINYRVAESRYLVIREMGDGKQLMTLLDGDRRQILPTYQFAEQDVENFLALLWVGVVQANSVCHTKPITKADL